MCASLLVSAPLNVKQKGYLVGNLEALVVLLNLIIIGASYYLLYPKVAGNDFNKIAFYDLFSSGLALLLVGSKFWGTGQVFNLIGFELNWFWFTLVTYAVIEIPISVRYLKKHNVDTSFK